jgi:hypothetical protein
MAVLGTRSTAVRHAFIMLIVAAALARAEGPIVDQYQIKAIFLFNFAKFVEWPPAAFKSNDEPLSICVLGRNPFGSMLEDAVRGKTAGTRTFVVREVSTAQQAGKCHILFVSGLDQKRSLDDLKGSNTLTVGETDDFLANGGAINFKLKDSRVRIEIDPSGAERAGLRISSKLLSLAEISKK